MNICASCFFFVQGKCCNAVTPHRGKVVDSSTEMLCDKWQDHSITARERERLHIDGPLVRVTPSCNP